MAMATIESADARRFPRWAIWVTVIVLFLLTLYAAWRIGLRRAIARELAAMKAEGYPTTPAELEKWYAYRTILRIALSSEQLRRLQAAFEGMNDPLAMERAMVSEVVCAHSLYVRPGILSLADAVHEARR